MVRVRRLQRELHHPFLQRTHRELLQDLVVLLVLRRSDVDEPGMVKILAVLPIYLVLERLQTLESHVQNDRRLERSWVVLYRDVSDIN
jgi:hypothetical protein